MKTLVTHLVREHLAEIANKSLLDCHVRGLHSIMLLDTPEQRVRLFVATERHELWRNTAESLGSIAAHPHHCNITLHCIQGAFVNLEYAISKTGKYLPYIYRSALLNGTGGFTKSQRNGPVALIGQRAVGVGDSLALPAYHIHSVSVPPGQRAAWFVYEGKEDAQYSSLSYSDQDLEQADFQGLYGKMDEQQVISLLVEVGLLDTTSFK
jgi:hypothetical protein